MSEQIWSCTVGGEVDRLVIGADYPMRQAVETAFRQVTGRDPKFNFSGWGSKLTEGERAVVEARAIAATPSEALAAEVDDLGAESIISSDQRRPTTTLADLNIEGRSEAPRDAAREALIGIVEALRSRHYGRMPDEMQRAYDRALAAIERRQA